MLNSKLIPEVAHFLAASPSSTKETDMNIGGKEFSEADLVMLLLAVKRVLTSDRNITGNNAALLAIAIYVGLVTRDECDLG